MTTTSNGGRQNKKLYRIPNQKKFLGVCAGLAEYWGFEVWVVRIIAVSLVLLQFPAVFLAYFVLYIVLDPKPGSEKISSSRTHKRDIIEDQEQHRPYNPSVKEVWKSGDSPESMLNKLESTFGKIENRLQKLERHVTSSKFELERAFSKMGQ